VVKSIRIMIILTTLYNSENYIERCIGTMLVQTHKDFKCYITDDMSTDNSVKLAKEMTEGDDRFIIIENSDILSEIEIHTNNDPSYTDIENNGSEFNDSEFNDSEFNDLLIESI